MFLLAIAALAGFSFCIGRASKSTIVVFTKAPEIREPLPTVTYLPSARQRRAWRLP